MTRRDGASSFANRSVLITGGASGIGRAVAAELLQSGAHVVLADVEGAKAAAKALESVVTDDGSVVGRELDVTDATEFRVIVDDAVERFGRLDVLVNNAGISLGGPTHELTEAHWQRIIDINLRGVVNGILAAYPRMVEQRTGQIVNTASGAGLVAPPFVAAYAATKHAVVGLSTALRPEAALHGVKVNVLCPGAVETAILDRRPPGDLPGGASRPVTAREYLEVVRQAPVPADRFARLAVRAIAADQGVIVVPRSARSLWYIHRLSPALTLRVTALLAKRVDRKLVRPLHEAPTELGG